MHERQMGIKIAKQKRGKSLGDFISRKCACHRTRCMLLQYETYTPFRIRYAAILASYFWSVSNSSWTDGSDMRVLSCCKGQFATSRLAPFDTLFRPYLESNKRDYIVLSAHVPTNDSSKSKRRETSCHESKNYDNCDSLVLSPS
jgi:hypothetical protein